MPLSTWSRLTLSHSKFILTSKPIKFTTRLSHIKTSPLMPKLRFEKELSPEISSHLTNKFVPIEKETFYCKDSRGDSENFGAPGGDFGEFLLALDCYEKVSGKRGNLSAESVDEIFEKWLNERCSKERPFYLHSDRPALNRLLKSVHQEGLNLPIDIEDSTKKDEFIEKFE